ncbi:MAG TPA: hypothetical protein VIX89_06660 [Bryobacteraceae bacterium]
MKTRPIFHLQQRRSSNKYVEAAKQRLPDFDGRSISIRFLPKLSAGSRKLYSNRNVGQPVFAATFIRKREIVFDQELERKPAEMARILAHELFHFAWVRLGNPARRSYEALLRRERNGHARGELGWSAEYRKLALPRRPPAAKWRAYVCESFCDTAAWLYSGIRRHGEFTLAGRHRERRAEWFRAAFGDRGIPI